MPIPVLLDASRVSVPVSFASYRITATELVQYLGKPCLLCGHGALSAKEMRIGLNDATLSITCEYCRAPHFFNIVPAAPGAVS